MNFAFYLRDSSLCSVQDSHCFEHCGEVHNGNEPAGMSLPCSLKGMAEWERGGKKGGDNVHEKRQGQKTGKE